MKKNAPHILVLTISLLLWSTEAQEASICKDTNLCLEGFCSKCISGGCQSNFRPPENETGTMLKMFQKEEDLCDCCPEVFIPFIDKGEKCFSMIDNYELQDKGSCGPGLYCTQGGNSYTCQRKVSKCHDEQDRYDLKLEEGNLGMDETRPLCDEDGFYEPLQCFFSGVCRCVEKVTGEPIFGFAVNPETALELEVDCECARESQLLRELSCGMEVNYEGPSTMSRERFVAEYTECMKNHNFLFQDHLRCMPSGNYDKAQCIGQVMENEDAEGRTEVCFCMDEKMNLTSSIVAIANAHQILECNMDDTHYAGYYRPCELARKKYLEEKRGLEEDGSLYLSNEWVGLCSPDGFYHIVQRDKNKSSRGECSDKLGNKIESFTGEFQDMDCFCAQVRDAMSPTDDRPTCLDNGAFRKFQCRGERCYCVDRNGKQTRLEEDLISFNPSDCDQVYA